MECKVTSLNVFCRYSLHVFKSMWKLLVYFIFQRSLFDLFGERVHSGQMWEPEFSDSTINVKTQTFSLSLTAFLFLLLLFYLYFWWILFEFFYLQHYRLKTGLSGGETNNLSLFTDPDATVQDGWSHQWWKYNTLGKHYNSKKVLKRVFFMHHIIFFCSCITGPTFQRWHPGRFVAVPAGILNPQLCHILPIIQYWTTSTEAPGLAAAGNKASGQCVFRHSRHRWLKGHEIHLDQSRRDGAASVASPWQAEHREIWRCVLL